MPRIGEPDEGSAKRILTVVTLIFSVSSTIFLTLALLYALKGKPFLSPLGPASASLVGAIGFYRKMRKLGEEAIKGES